MTSDFTTNSKNGVKKLSGYRIRTLLILIFFYFDFSPKAFGQIIEDFEPPHDQWRVGSYPFEDNQPNSWDFDDTLGAENTTHSLFLFGNTWKTYDISDRDVHIQANTIWEIWCYAPIHGTVQAFGLSDGNQELKYTFEASDTPPRSDSWITAYTGWKNTFASFQLFKLPVGRDWNNRYGCEEPVQISQLIFANDEDSSAGEIYFDQISDITELEPNSPHLDLGDDITTALNSPVSFSSVVSDPDSTDFIYQWDFGDGAFSEDSNPVHMFKLPGLYNVLCHVEDPTGLYDLDSLHVIVGTDFETPMLSLLFGGDCMFARRYEEPDIGNPLILPGDEGEGAKNIAYHTRRFHSDFRIINLESPLTDRGSPHPTKSISFRSRPDAVAGITEMNAHLVNLANNHLVDYMDEGLSQTLEVLSNPEIYSPYARPGKIPSVGGGSSRNEAIKPETIAIDGLRIGFIGLCSIVGHPSNEQPFFHAGYNKPGVLYLNEPNLTEAVNELNAVSDLTVVLIHGGIEYASEPDPSLQVLARKAIDLGADLIVCHHPHVSQGIEFYQGNPIVYSLGNYVFDQMYQETMSSFLVETRLDQTGVQQISLMPVYLEQFEPKFIQGDAGLRKITHLMGLSEILGTTVLPDPGLLRGNVLLPHQEVNVDTQIINYPIPTTYDPALNSYISKIIEIPQTQHLSELSSVHDMTGSKWVLLGRDKFLFGSFEDTDLDNDSLEGTGWEFPDWAEASAGLSDYTPYNGEYCLRLRRHESQTATVTTWSRWRIPVDQSERYAINGFFRLVNARNARISIKYYTYPYLWDSWWDEEVVVIGPLQGETDWTYFQSFLNIPSNTFYASIQLSLEPPISGDYAYAYFDDIRFIEFDESWNPDIPIIFPRPGAVKYLAVRSLTAQENASTDLKLDTYFAVDSDNDTVFDFLEDVNGDGKLQRGETDPEVSDTDGDGLTDGEELTFGLDSAVTCPWHPDTDKDGYDDGYEFFSGTDPNDNRSYPTGPTSTPTITPHFSVTPTPPPAPTSTFTPVWSNTPTPVETQSTITPPTGTPSNTQTPRNTPTPSSTSSPTPESSPSPTPTSHDKPVFLEIELSNNIFIPNTVCWVSLNISNFGQSISGDLYFLLEIFGEFWCYPSWCSCRESLDMEQVDLSEGYSGTKEILAPFTFPVSDYAGPFGFYGILFAENSLNYDDALSNLTVSEFFIGNPP